MNKAIIFILINLVCLVVAQDVLTLKNGKTYEVTIVEITNTSILFKAKGKLDSQTISIETVETVKTQNGKILYDGKIDSSNAEEKLADITINQHIRIGNIRVKHSTIFYSVAILIVGAYLYQTQAGEYSLTRKMVILK